MHIDGSFKGTINCEELVIGIRGKLEGEIKAEKLYVYGELLGKAVVDSLFIAGSAKLKGDVTHSSIAIEPGAYIDGSCIRADRLQPSSRQVQQVNKAALSADSRPVEIANSSKTVVLSVGSSNTPKKRISK